MVALYLVNKSKESIRVDFGFRVKDSKGNNAANIDWGPEDPHLFGGVNGRNNWRHNNFAEHSDVMTALVAGTLIVEVRMTCADARVNPLPFVARNPSRDMVRNLFLGDESAGVVFEVEEWRTSDVVKFHAH